jgi:hypothetical protein
VTTWLEEVTSCVLADSTNTVEGVSCDTQEEVDKHSRNVFRLGRKGKDREGRLPGTDACGQEHVESAFCLLLFPWGNTMPTETERIRVVWGERMQEFSRRISKEKD